MILGIDPAVYNIGWCVLDVINDELIYVDSGCIENKEKDKNKLYFNILDFFGNLLKKYPITQVAIEDSFVNINLKTSLILATARGVCMAKFLENKIPVDVLKPTEIKKIITGSGKAEKTQVEYMVKQILKIEKDFKKHDETDAIAIAIACGINLKKY